MPLRLHGPELLREQLVDHGGPVGRRVRGQVVRLDAARVASSARPGSAVPGSFRSCSVRSAPWSSCCSSGAATPTPRWGGRSWPSPRPADEGRVGCRLAARSGHTRRARRRREVREARGQVALPAGRGRRTRPVVEPRTDPDRAARHHVIAPVAVDVTGLDRRVVLRVPQPRVDAERQRCRRRQLDPRVAPGRVRLGLQAAAIQLEHLITAVPSMFAVRSDPHRRGSTPRAADPRLRRRRREGLPL